MALAPDAFEKLYNESYDESSELKKHGKRWCATVFNYGEHTEPNSEFLEKCSYLRYGEEVCPKTGKDHLQMYLVLKADTRGSTLRAMFNRYAPWKSCRFFKCKGTTLQNQVYTGKLDQPVTNQIVHEYGVAPTAAEDALLDDAQEHSEKLWRAAEESGAQGVRLLDPKAALRYYSAFQSIRKETLLLKPPCNPPDLNNVCGLWIWGLAGSGKSTMAKKIHDSYWIKLKSMDHWTGYRNQKIVIMDDMDRKLADRTEMKDELKQLGHSHAFPVRILYKEATMVRPQMCIISSNYPIHEISFDEEWVKAMKRRYAVIFVAADNTWNFTPAIDRNDQDELYNASREQMLEHVKKMFPIT